MSARNCRIIMAGKGEAYAREVLEGEAYLDDVLGGRRLDQLSDKESTELTNTLDRKVRGR